MADKISRTQRWLDLIAYLVARRIPAPVEELMERVPAYAEKWPTGTRRTPPPSELVQEFRELVRETASLYQEARG